ncbi:MAG: DUF4169 family protein [Rhodospirillales bacterium]
MGDIVNLNAIRKRKERARAERLAAEHRLKFGRSAAEKTVNRFDSSRDKKDLDGKRLDDGEKEPA